MNYESTITVQSSVLEGVSFTIQRMSFGRRIELTSRIREIGAKIQYLDAGDSIEDKLESALISNEIDRLYLEWGLKEIHGLTVDGTDATPARLVTDGPEKLFREVVEAIKSECGLSGEERKN